MFLCIFLYYLIILAVAHPTLALPQRAPGLFCPVGCLTWQGWTPRSKVVPLDRLIWWLAEPRKQLGRVAAPQKRGLGVFCPGLEQYLRTGFDQLLWFMWQCPAKVLIYLLKNKTSHFSAYENHWIGTLAFLSVSFSFAITYHLLPCRQLVNI